MKKRELRVKGVMSSNVQTCHPGDSLERAAQLLWDYDCGCLPVTDGQGIVGAMITDRDICMAAFSQGLPIGELRVSDSMSTELVTCSPEDELAVAADKMAKHQVRRLPVLNEQGRLEGLLSVNDLACCYSEDRTRDDKNSITAEMLHILKAVSEHRREPKQSAGSCAGVQLPQTERIDLDSRSSQLKRSTLDI